MLAELLFVLSTLGAPGSMAQTPSVKVVAASERSRAVPAVKGGVSATLEAREVQTSIAFPSGKLGEADLLVLYEPKSGLSWWKYQLREGGKPGGFIERFLADSVVYSTEDSIVSFTFLTPSLWIRESRERWPSLAEAQAHALAELDARRGEIEAGSLEGYREVKLGAALGSDFLILRHSAAAFPPPKVRQVAKVGDQWRVVLEGPNKDRATVVLSSRFELVSVTREANPATPP